MTSPDGLDLAALQKFFDTELPGTGELSAELMHGGRSNLTYRLTDGRSTWVLRRPPLGGLTPSAHDMAREYRVVAALWGTPIPVARAVALCEDLSVLGVPFAVVDYVAGPVIRTRDELHALPQTEITRCANGLIDVLAALHAVDPESVGLGGFGRPQGYLGRQVRRWYDQWTRVATRELADLERLHELLEQACPAEAGASIVHGDFRIDNAILDADDPGTVRAIVDWEMSTLGDPLADLGLHLAYADGAFDSLLGRLAAATSPLMPSRDDVLARYATTSGRDLPNMSFYIGLGLFKVAVIAEGIHARYALGMTRGTGFDKIGGAVPALAAAGLAALSRA